MRASITFAAGQSSEIGQYGVPCEESLPGLGMGMTNEVFQIEGILLNLKEWLKRAVRYSVALGLRFFKWKMLSRSGLKALLLLQLLIALVTIAVVNIGAVSCDFFLASLDTYRVSREEECMPSFDVVNCLLNLLAMSSFGDEVGFSLKTIASFSTVGVDLPSIALIVLHSLDQSVLWSMVSTNCFHLACLCAVVVLVISSFRRCNSGEV